MLAVFLNKDKYKYDIHSLIKAFYPDQDVKMFLPQESEGMHSDEGTVSITLYMCEEQGYIELVLTHPDGTSMRKKIACSMGDHGHNTVPADYATNGSKESLQTPKNALKQIIYEALSMEKKEVLPWGTLTGIRPVKIPMMLLEEGRSRQEIHDYMKSVFYASEEKTELSIDIAEREHRLLQGIDYKRGYSLYIGIPFCPTTCLYCSFTSYPIGAWEKEVDDYVTCLEKEIDYVAQSFADKQLDTIYIGGGTPTTLLPEQMDRLLGKLESVLDYSHLRELTVESGRPDSITPAKLAVMKKHHVSRISVNPQTMHDKTLKMIGRQHTVQQTIDAYYMAREQGFDNINMDIILGLPGETEDDVRTTMEEIRKLRPDDLTVHSLAIKRASRLQEWIRENGIKTINNTDDMMRIAAEGADRMGLKPYYLYRQKNMAGNFENTGYAVEGKAGIYNILIMEEKESIIALGAGSVSKAVYDGGRIERCDNVRDVKLYMEKIEEMIARKHRLFGN